MAFPLSDEEHQAIKARIEAQEEIIVSAAVRFDGAIISVERPGRHGNCLNWLSRHGISRDARDHGFLTNRGRFVDRVEAAQIVAASGQGSASHFPGYLPALHSEDMWNDHDREPHGPINPATIFAEQP